jgi:hypothetical protein
MTIFSITDITSAAVVTTALQGSAYDFLTGDEVKLSYIR